MKKIMLAWFLVSVLMMHHEAMAKIRLMSQEELTQAADLVIIGEVSKVDKGEGNEKCATVVVKEVVKGKCGSEVVVRFAVDPNMEPDMQDANLEKEDKVLLYLKPYDKSKNYYYAIFGPNGVVKLREGQSL